MNRQAFLLSLFGAGGALAAAPDRPMLDPAFATQTAELAQRLSESSDPRELWVAARLLKQLEIRATPLRDVALVEDSEALVESARQRDALMQRALAQGVDDPLLAWIAATPACPASPAVCDAPSAVRRLRELVPSNAAVWWYFPDAAHADDGDASAAETDIDLRLQHAIDASRFDTYGGERLRAYVEALERLPAVDPGAPMVESGIVRATGPVRAVIAFSMHLVDDEPGVSPLRQACEQRDADPMRNTACLHAAQRAMEKADSLQTHRLASGLLLNLLPDGEKRLAVLRAERTLWWQQAAAGELMESRADDPSDSREIEWLAEAVGCLRQPGGNELRCTRELLRREGIGLEPPADWRASWESLPVETLPPR